MPTSFKDIQNIYQYLPKADFNYAVNISEISSFIYIETAKVACSTIKRTLQDIEAEVLREPPLPSVRNVHNKLESPLLSPVDVGIEKLFEMLSDSAILKFSFVRNPYTRALSAYLDKVKKESLERIKIIKRLEVSTDTDISFETFLRCVRDTPVQEMDHHWRPQSYQLLPDMIEYDFIGRFERLSSDFEQVLYRIYSDFSTSDRKVRRYSPHSTQADARIFSFYTPSTIDLVAEIYQKDFQNFNYSFKFPSEGVNAIDERYLSYFEKGKNYLECGDIEQAIEAMQSSIQLNPEYCWAHHCLGNAFLWNKQEENALLAYRRATELNPDLSASHRRLGDIFKNKGDIEKARNAYLIADQLDK